MNRIVLSAVVGGIVVFLWGAVSHMALPLGDMGLSVLPDEGAVMSALESAKPPHGAYMFPAHPQGTEGPQGLLIYHPGAPYGMTSRQLVRELLGDIGAALLAAMLLSASSATHRGRALTGVTLGLFAWFSISFPSWNWYRFPAGWILAEAIDQVVGWTLACLAMSFVLPVRASARG